MAAKLRPAFQQMRKMLGERVRDLRRRQGLSQGELQAIVPMTLTTLSNIERGATTDVDLSNVVALAEALGTTPDVLLGYAPLPAMPETPRTS